MYYWFIIYTIKPINIDKKNPILKIRPPLEPPWWGDYNGGINSYNYNSFTVIITNNFSLRSTINVN